MRPGSTPSRLAATTSASTFSWVFPRYPIILAALAAFCAGEAADRICPSVTGGYIDNQNWRRNSLAAVWHVVNWRKRPSGMSSVCTEDRLRLEASSKMKYKIRQTFAHLHLQTRGHILSHCDERCVACLVLQLKLRVGDACQCSLTPRVRITYVFQIIRPTPEAISHPL